MSKLPLLAALALFFVNDLGAQCVCVASTATADPNISIPGPPAWSATGTITDVGKLNGRCVKAGCTEGHGCRHSLAIDLDVTYPSTTVPAPRLKIRLKLNNQNLALIDVPPTSVTDNGNGTTTNHYDFASAFWVDCKPLAEAITVGGYPEFTPPGGGAPITSGSAVMTCSGCGP